MADIRAVKSHILLRWFGMKTTDMIYNCNTKMSSNSSHLGEMKFRPIHNVQRRWWGHDCERSPVFLYVIIVYFYLVPFHHSLSLALA